MTFNSINCEDIYELAEYILDEVYEAPEGYVVACVGTHGMMKGLIVDLILESEGELEFEEVDFVSIDDSEEFLLTICDSGIYVEPLTIDNEYFPYIANTLFIDGDMSSAILDKCITKDECLVVDYTIGEEEEVEKVELGDIPDYIAKTELDREDVLLKVLTYLLK